MTTTRKPTKKTIQERIQSAWDQLKDIERRITALEERRRLKSQPPRV